MGLYIAYAFDISKRQTGAVFFFKQNKCYSFEKKGEPKELFGVKNIDVNAYKQVASYAEQHKLDAYEVVLYNNTLLNGVLEFFSSYLLDKDISIGILTDDEDLIESEEDLIDSYGVNHSRFDSFLADQSIFESRIRRESAPKMEMNLIHPRFSVSFVAKEKRKQKPSPALGTIKLEESFHDKFMKYLIESDKDNVDVYKAAGISRQVFSKILSDKNFIPSKLTIVSLCIGLNLTLKESKELLHAAGYSLSGSLTMDSIVMKYLRAEVYDFDRINSELNEYGCPILGWHPREK